MPLGEQFGKKVTKTQPKDGRPSRIRLTWINGAPKLNETRLLLAEAQTNSGILCELPIRSPIGTFLLTCQSDHLSAEPCWTMYEGEDGGKQLWTYIDSNVDIIHDIVSMSCLTKDGKSKVELPPGLAAAPGTPAQTSAPAAQAAAPPQSGQPQAQAPGLQSGGWPQQPTAPQSWSQAAQQPQQAAQQPQQAAFGQPDTSGWTKPLTDTTGWAKPGLSGGWPEELTKAPEEAAAPAPDPTPMPQAQPQPQPQMDPYAQAQPYTPAAAAPMPQQMPQQQMDPYAQAQPYMPAGAAPMPQQMPQQQMDPYAQAQPYTPLGMPQMNPMGMSQPPNYNQAQTPQAAPPGDSPWRSGAGPGSPGSSPADLARFADSLDGMREGTIAELAMSPQLPSALVDPALKLQEMVLKGHFAENVALLALKYAAMNNGSLTDTEITRAKGQLTSTPNERAKKAAELLRTAGIMTENDIERAEKLLGRHDNNMTQALLATGKVDKLMLQAAQDAQSLLTSEKLRPDKAIIALLYCQRSRVSLKDALDDLSIET